MMLIVFLNEKNSEEIKTIAFVDESTLVSSAFIDSETTKYIDLTALGLDEAKLKTEAYYYGLVYIPKNKTIQNLSNGVAFYSADNPSINVITAIENKLETLVIAYTDRLYRIGYALIEHILTKYSKTNIIVDLTKNETVNEEMANDILQIVTFYRAKINGMRKYKKAKIDSI